MQKIVDMCGRFRRAVTCREDDTLLPPRTSGPVPRAGPSSRRSAPAAQSGPPPPPPVTMATPSAFAARPTYVPLPAQLYSAGKSYSDLVSLTIPHHVKLYSSTCTSYSCSSGSSSFPPIDPYGAGSSSRRRLIHNLGTSKTSC